MNSVVTATETVFSVDFLSSFNYTVRYCLCLCLAIVTISYCCCL